MFYFVLSYLAFSLYYISLFYLISIVTIDIRLYCIDVPNVSLDFLAVFSDYIGLHRKI